MHHEAFKHTIKNKKDGCSSKYIGVYFEERRSKWVGRTRHEGHRYSTREFVSENVAAAALKKLAKELKGDEARILEIV